MASLFNPSTTRDAPHKGSSIGSDPSMISANHRLNKGTSTSRIARNNTCTMFTMDTRNNNNNNKTGGGSKRAFSADTAAAAEGAMEDEYGEMTDDGHTFIQHNFVLESGIVLEEAQLRYQLYGKLDEVNRDNVIVVCHALTGNASLHSWWGDLLGRGKAFDTSKYLVVCCNILGSCYGSTSPQSENPSKADGSLYSTDFPDVSVQDTVKLQLILLQKELKVKSVKAVIGGSFGGMQAVEFAVQAGRTGGDFTEGGTGDQKGNCTGPNGEWD
jgi:hypothetical protein